MIYRKGRGVAQAYYIHLVKPNLNSLRSSIEIQIMCVALDLLRARRYEEAGDILTERLKAVKTVDADDNWSRTRNLELVMSGHHEVKSETQREKDKKVDIYRKPKGWEIPIDPKTKNNPQYIFSVRFS